MSKKKKNGLMVEDQNAVETETKQGSRLERGLDREKTAEQVEKGGEAKVIHETDKPENKEKEE